MKETCVLVDIKPVTIPRSVPMQSQPSSAHRFFCGQKDIPLIGDKMDATANPESSASKDVHDTNKRSFSEQSIDVNAVPDGGVQAWLVAGGAACITFSTLGFSNSFGIFQEYYATHQLRGESPDNIAWIGSLSAFLMFAAGLTCNQIIWPAATLYVFGVMMVSISKQYWHFMLSQGVLLGVVMGFLQFPAFAAVSQFFHRKRAAALGMAIAGSSVGGVVLPIALSKMLNDSSLGFGWSVRVIGFVLAPLLAFASLTIRARLPPRKSSFFIWSAFKSPRYCLLIASSFFMFMGFFTPLFYIPSYAVHRGVNPTLASYLLALVNAASTFGRIVPGILADKFGPLNIFSIAGIITGVVILCLNQVTSTAGLIVYSLAFGFVSGTIISGAAASFTWTARDPRDVGTYMGMGMAFAGFASLIGPPVNGVLLEKYSGFSQASILSGVVCLVGGLIALASKATTSEGILGKV
nr:aspyridones efflux protein apdf [Quercus suber]